MRRKHGMNYKVALTILVAGVTFFTGCGSNTAKQVEYVNKGIELMEEGSYEEALEDFQASLTLAKGKITDETVDICYYKAEAQYRMEDYDGALETYQSLLDYEETAKTYFLRAKLYYLMGESDSAKADLEKAVSLDKKNIELYINVYDVLKDNGEEELGKEYLEKAVKLGGNGAKDSYQKGRIEYILGNTESAKGYFETALKGKITGANFYLAELAKADGDTDKADEYIKAYLDSGEAESTELELLGIDYMNDGDYSKAITYLKDALELDSVPNKQSIMKNLVIAYEKNLDFTAAEKMNADYIKLYPDDQDAAREEVFLDTRVNGIQAGDSESTEESTETVSTTETTEN